MLNHRFIEYWGDYCLAFEGCTLIGASHDAYSIDMNFGDDWFTDISDQRVDIELIERFINHQKPNLVMKLIDIYIERTRLHTLEEVDSPVGAYYIEYNEE